MEIVLVIVGLGVLTSSLTYSVAKSKGLDAESWAWAGFFVGIFALIAAAGMADKKQRSYMRFLAEAQGWKEKEAETERVAVGGSGSDPIGISEDYSRAVSMYNENGGRSVPDFEKSKLFARAIILTNSEGDELAQFSNKQGQWRLVELYK